MRIIPTSGGVEFGPEGGPWIDVIPLPGLPPIQPGEIEQLAKSLYSWRPWTREMIRDTGLPVLVPSGMRGIYGSPLTHGVTVRFLWKREQSPSEALQEVEESEGGLPPALAGAVLAAASAKEYPVTHAPFTMALLCGLLPSEGPTRYSRREIGDLADHYIDALTGKHTEALIPGGATDRARFWLQVARRLWEPEIRRRIARATVDLENRALVTALATGWAELRQIRHIETAGLRLHAPAYSGMWPHLIEWEQYPPPAQVLRFLVGNHVPVGMPVVLAEPPGRTPVDEALTRDLAEAFLEEAEESAAYAPAGEFVLLLPDEYPLQKWGVKALRIHADPEGLWAAGMDTNDKVLFALRWQPDRLVAHNSWVVTEEPAALLDVTLAALWRDLRVAGEEAVPRRQRTGATRGTARRAERRTGERVYTLPRRRRAVQRVSLSGTRTWGTREDHLYIQEAHDVPGHVRRLPPGWKASDEAKRRARLAGIVLPAGHTYVRPHPRRVWVRADGRPADRQAENRQRARTVKARGLATVLVFLKGAKPSNR